MLASLGAAPETNPLLCFASPANQALLHVCVLLAAVSVACSTKFVCVLCIMRSHGLTHSRPISDAFVREASRLQHIHYYSPFSLSSSIPQAMFGFSPHRMNGGLQHALHPPAPTAAAAAAAAIGAGRLNGVSGAHGCHNVYGSSIRPRSVESA